MIEDSLNPPYYAVIFTTVLSDNLNGYDAMLIKIESLEKQQKGYLGIESARSAVGITVSYWEDLDAIVQWKNNIEHIQAREMGRAQWYKKYQLRICKVEREYGFNK
ncbi:antibiotic biosynthesis monooxygenase family protein [Tenacibaculum finnmarkense]|uniref:antibiotic biosynthesis monooxygenase family protein n=1 Tax=Tenacibaculum finnmarkense TaxID=2781243 RepID=UPI001EFBDAA8|nr:antibiotic biosynthesis monooxygenase [Tenacibaculum finnmarkense]MCG8750017.1 antibiotic biosynthesis monooxygenase [Tenacibaculum finnmarkense]MCG8755209.1 antibiotic biosynthesis monooxygenase [Tenacibaculum finnmarkense]MCG8783584.1 antibiotic biosynthesis monooxygenase [Tenacibaculum finnmarkense]